MLSGSADRDGFRLWSFFRSGLLSPSFRSTTHLRLLLINCGGCSSCLHIGRSGGTSDNFDQLAGNDGLAGTVEENLVLADHLAGVLGSVLHKG